MITENNNPLKGCHYKPSIYPEAPRCEAWPTPALPTEPYTFEHGGLAYKEQKVQLSTPSFDAPKIVYKYNEDKNFQEILEYIKTTYVGHYTSSNGTQAIDLIASGGHAESFCLASILKYAARFGKKNGKNRKDIYKIVHYALMLIHFSSCTDQNDV